MIFNVLCSILFPTVICTIVFLRIDKSFQKVEKSVSNLNTLIIDNIKVNNNLSSIDKIA